MAQNGPRKLSPAELANLAETALVNSKVVGNVSGGPITLHGGLTADQTIDAAEWTKRKTTATAIMIAESNGWTDARCFDGPYPSWVKARPPVGGGIDANGFPTPAPAMIPLSPYPNDPSVLAGLAGVSTTETPKPNTPTLEGLTANCNAPGKGVDRGLWQFNSLAFPTMTDSQCDDPTTATAKAFGVSNGFRDWGPWHGSKGLDTGSVAYQAAQKAVESASGATHDETPGPSSVKDLVSWASGLTKLLSFITSAAFWRRFGIGLLGALLILVAVALTQKGLL